MSRPLFVVTCLFLFAVACGAADVPAPPAVGSPAPAFALPDQTGATRSLADYRGKWLVLYFYPKDGTPGCTKEVCAFRDSIEQVRKAGARAVGVTVDDGDSVRKF